ncbi:MAG: hypothetical protein ABEH43_06535, partial [Flavobacteriales bacterium]
LIAEGIDPQDHNRELLEEGHKSKSKHYKRHKYIDETFQDLTPIPLKAHHNHYKRLFYVDLEKMMYDEQYSNYRFDSIEEMINKYKE